MSAKKDPNEKSQHQCISLPPELFWRLKRWIADGGKLSPVVHKMLDKFLTENGY